MVIELYSFEDGRPLRPLRYSSGITQFELAEKIVKLWESGVDIVLLRGQVGTGKSVVAIYSILGYSQSTPMGIILVPTKVLQKQYFFDYQKRLFFRKDGRKIVIRFLMGKQNFRCKITRKKATNSENICESEPYKPLHISRIDMIAEKCPYYVLVAPFIHKTLTNNGWKIKQYNSICGNSWFIHIKEYGCKYYSSFTYYLNSDIIVMNNAKWLVETKIGRKSNVDVEVIDEFDYFFDSLAKQWIISKGKIKILPADPNIKYEKEFFMSEVERLLGFLDDEESIFLREYVYYDDFVEALQKLCDALIENGYDGFSRYQGIVSTLIDIKLIANKVSVMKKNNRLFFAYPNIREIWKEIARRSAKKMLLMSATIPSEKTLKNVYGLKNYVITEGETRIPGTVKLLITQKELAVTHETWEKIKNKYWDILLRCLEYLPKPILIHAPAKKYVPAEYEKHVEKTDYYFEQFKKGKIDIVFTTIAIRGVDLRGNMVNSIVILKDPIPDLSAPLIKSMKEHLKNDFSDYIRDLADRKILQMIGRGLRKHDDEIFVWSPDILCLKRIIFILQKYRKSFKPYFLHL